MCGGVVAQQLDAEPPDAIQGHIGREQSTVTDCEAAVQIDQRGEYQQVPNQLVEERRLHHDRDLPGRDAVERMNVDESGGIPTIENLQAPRHRGLAAVQLLVEVIPEPTDRLAHHHAWCDRVQEGRQWNSATTTADPGSNGAQGHCTPDTEAAIPDAQRRAQPGAAFAKVCLPVGAQVVQTPADQTKRDHPQSDVVDHPALTAACGETPVTDHQAHNDPDDDEECVRANRQWPEMPDATRRTGEIRKYGRRHGEFLWRTPAASSSVSERKLGNPSPNADTNADPTMTPSA